MLKPILSLSLSLIGLAALVGCDASPNGATDTSGTTDTAADTGEGDTTETPPPFKVDIHFVVDNTSHMQVPQNALVDAFPAFRAALARDNAEVRVAVTSIDMQCDPNGANIGSAMGTFNTVVTTAFPASAQHREKIRCTDDADCTAALGDAMAWECRQAQSATCLENPNGTINSTCRARCTQDAECQRLLAEETAFCLKPSTNPQDWGCIVSPRTAACPDTFPAVLEGDDLDHFACAATLGHNQERCRKYEQGLKASLAALEPLGPNAEQAVAFNRPDAHLVILYITNEDDCSTAPGEVIDATQYANCAFQRTTDDGGPLLPVAGIVSRLKALREGDSRVIVGVVTGDSVRADDAARDADRAAYSASKSDNRACYQQTYLCEDAFGGTAHYGERHIAVAEAFGEDGIVTNFCWLDPMASLLDQVAARLHELAAMASEEE